MVGARVNQEALFDIAKQQKQEDKQRAYRERNKVKKKLLKENDKLKWGEIGAPAKFVW